VCCRAPSTRSNLHHVIIADASSAQSAAIVQITWCCHLANMFEIYDYLLHHPLMKILPMLDAIGPIMGHAQNCKYVTYSAVIRNRPSRGDRQYIQRISTSLEGWLLRHASRETDRHTDTPITILCTPAGGSVKTTSSEKAEKFTAVWLNPFLLPADGCSNETSDLCSCAFSETLQAAKYKVYFVVTNARCTDVSSH